MWFLRDIVFPIVLALMAFALIILIINMILKFFSIDIPILKFAGLLMVWYYIGPIIYNWLISKIIVVPREGIRILYMPIHVILEAFEKLV